MWRLVKSQYIHLSDEYEETFKNYYIKAFDYWQDTPREVLCLATASQSFGMPLSKVYLDLKFYGKSKTLVRS